MSDDVQSLPLAVLMQEIATQAIKNPEFRKGLLANPKAFLTEALGIALPEDFDFQVVEMPANGYTLALPPLIGDADDLDDAELESVAGGAWKPQVKFALKLNTDITTATSSSRQAFLKEMTRDMIIRGQSQIMNVTSG